MLEGTPTNLFDTSQDEGEKLCPVQPPVDTGALDMPYLPNQDPELVQGLFLGVFTCIQIYQSKDKTH